MPELMFLDEPTTGLDPRSRNQVWDIIRAMTAQGTTILLCTQYLDEADQLADGIAVIDHGKVIAEGTPAQLKASVGGGGPPRAPARSRAAARGRASRLTGARRGPSGARPGAALVLVFRIPSGRRRRSASSPEPAIDVAEFPASASRASTRSSWR